MIRVGWARRNYGVERVVYGAVHPELVFRRVPHLPLTRLTKDPFWRHATVALAGRGVDLIHLYGDVALVNRPWVVSFEDAVPAGRPGTARRRAGLRTLAAARCRAVVAISEHARRRLDADPEAWAALGGKCETSWPCVPSEPDLFARHEEWLAGEPTAAVECLFVGNLFFLKGGEFVLDALEPLATRADPPVRLTVVSTLETDSYVSRVDASRVEAASARLSTSPWVRWEQRLSPRAVRERMAASHLLLFPTLHETFGFVLAEAQATGLDAVTVASRAIPEILPDALRRDAVRVGLNDAEEWVGTRLWRTAGDAAWRAAWEEARERVVEAIRARVRSVAADPAALRRRAALLRANHEARFAPERLGERLLAIYRRRL